MIKLFLYTILITCFSSFISAQVNLSNGLEAYFSFNGNADDVSGNNNHGSIFGSPTLVQDRFGNPNSAYSFDGLDDYINTYSTFDYTNRSVSLWIHAKDANGYGGTANVAITQDDDNLDYGKLRIDYSNNTLNLYAGGTTGEFTTSSTNLNSWAHLVLIREGNATKYYINNQLVHTDVSASTGSTYNPNPDFIIGAGRDLNQQFFEGKIDDIRIYNRAINECEINKLYTGSSSNLTLDLQAHYDFNGNPDDVSGNNNHGTTFGSPTLVQDRFGNPNSAYSFDGLDDYINTYSTFDYTNRSVSLWIHAKDANGYGGTANVAITQDDDNLNYGKLRIDYSNNTLNLYAGGTTGEFTTSSTNLNSWAHLVLIREGNATKYYINNQLVHTDVSASTGSTYNPNPDFIIGAGRDLNQQFFEGKIDDIRIYNRAINECEINSLYEIRSLKLQRSSESTIISLYPNPVKNYLTIKTKSEELKFKILDSRGRVVCNDILIKNDKQKIDISNLSRGIYYLMNDKYSIHHKIIKQ